MAGFILFFVGFLLLFIALLSWFLAKNSQQRRNKSKLKLLTKTSIEKPLIPRVQDINSSTEVNGIIPSSNSVETINKVDFRPPSSPVTVHRNHLPPSERKQLIFPFIRGTNISETLTRESSTATDDDDDDSNNDNGLNNFLRHYQTLPPVPTKIDEEYEERFSFKMNNSEELGLGYLINGINNGDHLTASNHIDFYRQNNQIGLIKPLNIRQNLPQRYTKYVSSYSKFVLPRPMR